MFNLLMFNVDWTTGSATVPQSRVFEYTEDLLTAQFVQNGQIQLDKLTRLPSVFCEEGVDDQVARVGQVNRIQRVGTNLLIEFSLDADVPPLQNSLLHARRNELHMPIENEFSRNHWAIKDVDLYRFLLRYARPRRQRPSVFQIAEQERIDQSLVSVMMPFEAAFDNVYRSIQEAARQVGLNCRRADDFWEHQAIIQDIVALIDRSKVVVCDCSGRNPNVFYEVGIAHSLGREVVLITQSANDIPFDLRHLRFIPYLNNAEGRARLITELRNRMATLIGH